jgi:hypothetical protein
MSESGQSDFTCTHCGVPVAEADTFCPNCGSLFSDDLVCSNHPTVPAEGVCVICSKPFCGNCGKESNRIFLCDPHWTYEIYEGMARVYGSTDNVQAQFVTSSLEQAGFHPFLYSRRFNPGTDIVTPGRMIRNFGKNPIVELKVLVPFAEVAGAEKALTELGFAGESGDDLKTSGGQDDSRRIP